MSPKPAPERRIVYFCKEPGCKWERLEPPHGQHLAAALRDLAMEYDTHEANDHPDSRRSGLSTRLSSPHATDLPDS